VKFGLAKINKPLIFIYNMFIENSSKQDY